MLTIPQILWCFVIPLAIALVVLLPKWRWTGALAVGAAFMVGYAGWPGVPELPPSNGGDWIFYLAAPLVVVGLIEGLVHMPSWVRAILSTVASIALLWVVLRPLTPHALSPTQAATGAALFGLAAAIAVESTHHLARREQGIGVSLALMIVAIAGAIVVISSGSMTQGMLAGPLVAATIAGVVLARRQPWARGGALVLLVLLASLLVRSHFYNFEGVTRSMALLVILAPVAAWIGRVPGLSSLRGWKRSFVMVIAVAVPVGIALALAIANQPEADPYGY